jgi:glyoxylase-like metal-dependent hydrolase (beta-lactamase superfamily II)
MPLGFTRISQDDVLTIGGRTWTVHIGNGHAPAHATLWCNEEPLVLAGDQVLPGISSNVGVYATEPNADPLAEWLESCERLATIASEEHFVFPGHKLPFTGLPARLKQLIENHHNGLSRLEEFLKTPRTAVDCFPVLFKRKIEGGNYGLAMVEAVAHLNHLLLDDKVTRQLDENGVWIWQKK